jgi:serine/threonine-protein kinase
MLHTTLLHYKIREPLGKGGMGEVYLADDTKLNRSVALKVLPPSVRDDPERLARFRREAEAAAQLNHPSIAQIHAIEEVDGPDGSPLLFIVMEYVDGRPLSEHLQPDGLPLDRFFGWAIPLADALSHAHTCGITHRDLKRSLSDRTIRRGP